MNAWTMLPPSPMLDAALSILADGKSRTADEILAEGRKRGLFPASENRHNIFGVVSNYINRALFDGSTPLVVKELGGRFRLNRPADDWPAIDTTGLVPLAIPDKPPPAGADAVSALLKAPSGSDPQAMELAVCAAFELFGFSATHLGRKGEPDGYVDALLGVLGYRVMLECKLSSGRGMTESDAPVEASKFRDAYRADYCALVAPAFSREVSFAAELRTHGVSAWTVNDIVRAATLRLDCSQMRKLFAAGYAAGLLDDLQWEMIHGVPRRLRVVASLLVEIGLSQQRMDHTLGDARSAPRLTADVALMLVDERLTAAGSTHGVTRDEIDAAFTWLTSPYVDRAVWTDDRNAIVIRPSTSSG
jgi:hypothetical protein